jgi:hypothetical protein
MMPVRVQKRLPAQRGGSPGLEFGFQLRLIFRGVIHAQGARIRAQGAPGYVHKEQAHKRGGRLTGVFTSQKVSRGPLCTYPSTLCVYHAPNIFWFSFTILCR